MFKFKKYLKKEMINKEERIKDIKDTLFLYVVVLAGFILFFALSIPYLILPENSFLSDILYFINMPCIILGYSFVLFIVPYCFYRLYRYGYIEYSGILIKNLEYKDKKN